MRRHEMTQPGPMMHHHALAFWFAAKRGASWGSRTRDTKGRATGTGNPTEGGTRDTMRAGNPTGTRDRVRKDPRATPITLRPTNRDRCNQTNPWRPGQPMQPVQPPNKIPPSPPGPGGYRPVRTRFKASPRRNICCSLGEFTSSQDDPHQVATPCSTLAGWPNLSPPG